MFLIMGVSPGEKQLDFRQTIICDHCGSYGRLEVVVTFMAFSLLFIPLFRWRKRYFVITTCCHGRSEIGKELGRAIAKGEVQSIDPATIRFTNEVNKLKHCQSCGFHTEQDFRFCPKCGSPF